MKQTINEIEINGTIYVPKDLVKSEVINTDGLKMVMVRTRDAGVHFGYLNKKESTLAGIEVELINSKRVWYWDGAASLSQLAMEGTSCPENCKIPCAVNSILLIAIEIIPMTEKSYQSLNKVKEWKN